MHLQKVPYTMPTSQHKEQSKHCILEEISLRVTHAGDQLLRLLAERIEFLSLVQILY